MASMSVIPIPASTVALVSIVSMNITVNVSTPSLVIIVKVSPHQVYYKLNLTIRIRAQFYITSNRYVNLNYYWMVDV